MRLKTEFRRRLERLYACLHVVLQTDSEGHVSSGNLFPYLCSAFLYVWMQKTDKLFKD